MKTKTVHFIPGIPLIVPVFLILPFLLIMSPLSAHGAALTMDVRPENTTVLHNSDGTSTIQIRIIAPDEIPLDDRPPLNLSLVLDKSGSMADSGKIGYLIQAAHMFVDRLGPDDILSIVTYDNRVRVPVSARKVRDREHFHRAIDGLYPGGRTYLSGGLEEGYRQVKKNCKRGYVSRVILLSDGLANVGVTNSLQLRRRTSSMYENGVSVSTFGMGLDFDEDLLSSVAYGSGGSYHYISRPDDIFAALSREFHMASRTIASGVQIIIRPLDGCRFESVPGHHWRMEKGAAVIGLGDLSAGETRTLMANVNVPTGSLGSVNIADVSVRFQNAVTGESDRQDPGAVSLLIVDDPRVHRENIDTEVQGNKVVIESSALMNEAAKKVDEGDKDGALSIIKRALGSLKTAPVSPAVKDEMQRVQDYSVDLEHMDEMAPAEQEEIQKELKFRNYQELHQQ
jgi:Ca-activated chloride channel family protein